MIPDIPVFLPFFTTAHGDVPARMASMPLPGNVHFCPWYMRFFLSGMFRVDTPAFHVDNMATLNTLKTE